MTNFDQFSFRNQFARAKQFVARIGYTATRMHVLQRAYARSPPPPPRAPFLATSCGVGRVAVPDTWPDVEMKKTG